MIFIRAEVDRVAATLPQPTAPRGGSSHSSSHGHVVAFRTNNKAMPPLQRGLLWLQQQSHATASYTGQRGPSTNLGVANEASGVRARHDLSSSHLARGDPSARPFAHPALFPYPATLSVLDWNQACKPCLGPTNLKTKTHELLLNL